MNVALQYFFIVLVGLSTLAIGYKIYLIKDTTDMILFLTTLIGLVVSFWAFLFAMRTYISIDSVNVITQMEGNVLENESYVTSYPSLLRKFNQQSQEEVSKAIFKELKFKFNKQSKTALDFSFNLQFFIDIIVFFPYLFNKNDKNIEEMEKLIKQINKKRNIFFSVGSGNLILIDETIKLIQAVRDYQILTTSEGNLYSSILDVRGSMLKNTVTQTVYFNYLGLYYNYKAHETLRKAFDVQKMDFFSLEGLQTLHSNKDKLTIEDAELIHWYLGEAQDAFKAAKSHEKIDVLWKGFIKFNEARVSYLNNVLHSDDQSINIWLDAMIDTQKARHRMTMLNEDIFKLDQLPFLQHSFIFEKNFALLHQFNFHINAKLDIPDLFGKPKFFAPDYKGLLDEPVLNANLEFHKKAEKYQKDLIAYLTKSTVQSKPITRKK